MVVRGVHELDNFRSMNGNSSAGDGTLLFSVVDVGSVVGLGVRSAAGAFGVSGAKTDGNPVSRGALTCRVGKPPQGVIFRVRVPVAPKRVIVSFFICIPFWVDSTGILW